MQVCINFRIIARLLGQGAFFAACFWSSTTHGIKHPSVPGQPQNTTHTAGHTIQKSWFEYESRYAPDGQDRKVHRGYTLSGNRRFFGKRYRQHSDDSLQGTVQLIQKGLRRLNQRWQCVFRHTPYRTAFDGRVAMKELVTKRNDLREVGNALGQGSIQFGQLIERFANDFKFALYCCLRHFVGGIGYNVHACSERLNRQSGVAHVPKKCARITLHRRLRGCG